MLHCWHCILWNHFIVINIYHIIQKIGWCGRVWYGVVWYVLSLYYTILLSIKIILNVCHWLCSYIYIFICIYKYIYIRIRIRIRKVEEKQKKGTTIIDHTVAVDERIIYL